MGSLVVEPCAFGPAERGIADLNSFLSVLQLSDSAFPSGRYTLSYGLETMAQSGELPAPSPLSKLATLLGDYIRFGVAPSDGVALACAHRGAWGGGHFDLGLVMAADERLTAVKLAREAREASTRTGRALLATATPAFGGTALLEYAERARKGHCPGNHAIVLGVLSASLGVPRLQAVVSELFAFSASWVAAAIRLALTDHRSAQSLLHRVRSVTAEAARQAVDKDVTCISSCTPVLDLMTMRHEQAEPRLFAT
jgi:urease accessory protein